MPDKIEPPETIYLQWWGTGDPSEPFDVPPDSIPDAVTWCRDRINDSDLEYRLVKRRRNK